MRRPSSKSKEAHSSAEEAERDRLVKLLLKHHEADLRRTWLKGLVYVLPISALSAVVVWLTFFIAEPTFEPFGVPPTTTQSLFLCFLVAATFLPFQWLWAALQWQAWTVVVYGAAPPWVNEDWTTAAFKHSLSVWPVWLTVHGTLVLAAAIFIVAVMLLAPYLHAFHVIVILVLFMGLVMLPRMLEHCYVIKAENPRLTIVQVLHGSARMMKHQHSEVGCCCSLPLTLIVLYMMPWLAFIVIPIVALCLIVPHTDFTHSAVVRAYVYDEHLRRRAFGGTFRARPIEKRGMDASSQ